MKRAAIAGFALAGFLGASALWAANPAYDIANILSGTFNGSSPGNELRLNFRSVTTDTNHPYDLFLDVSGKYQGETVKRQGLVRLETEGEGVYIGYVPHFNPTVTALSPDAARFSENETNAACGLTLSVAGDGFSGATSGASCTFALRGGSGKWSIELEPGTIVLRNVASGETLRFRREGK